MGSSPIIRTKNKASQRRCLVFLYDEDLNPPKKGTPQSRRLCGEEEQLQSGRLFSAQRNKAKAQRAATKVPSSAPKNKASQRRCLVFLYDEDLNPPKKGTPQSRRLCGEEEQLQSGRHFPRSGTRQKRSTAPPSPRGKAKTALESQTPQREQRRLPPQTTNLALLSKFGVNALPCRGYNPSVSFAASSPCTGEPRNALHLTRRAKGEPKSALLRLTEHIGAEVLSVRQAVRQRGGKKRLPFRGAVCGLRNALRERG